MSDVRIVRAGDIFRYDSSVDGYTDGEIFTSIGVSAPTVNGSNQLDLNNSKIQSRVALQYGTVQIRVTIPTAPTAGDTRFFILNSQVEGYESSMGFLISGTSFTANVFDKSGTATPIFTRTIPWDSDWTNTFIRLAIRRGKDYVGFQINDSPVAQFEDDSSRISLLPLNFVVANGNADDMLMTSAVIYGV